MQTGESQTGYARLSAPVATVCLVSIFLLASAFVALTLSPMASGYADGPDRGPGDISLYRAKVDRIHAGESYYQAAGRELRARGYPTRSLFNWRTPLPIWLIGVLPDVVVAKVLLGIVASVGWLWSFDLLAREGSLKQAAVGGILLFGSLMPVFLGDLFVMPEVWAGALILFSVAAYARGQMGLGIAGGAGALVCRELAAPYCLVAICLAIRDRRWREIAAWFGVLGAYGCFYAWHAMQVSARIEAGDIAHEQGWIRLGGAAFVISTYQMNCYLLLLPQWVTALYMVAALVGLAGWNSPAGTRIGLTVALYTIAFGIAGQPFNQYWGTIFAPLACFGVARFAASILDLCKAASAQDAGATSKFPQQTKA